jgi:hypothetical protein
MSRPAFPKIQWNNVGTVSGPFKLDGNQIVGFYLPNTTVSTSITFNAATTESIASGGIVWYPVKDSTGAAISFTVTASAYGYYGFSQDQIAKFTGVELLQMVAGSSEAANQNILVSIIPRPSI